MIKVIFSCSENMNNFKEEVEFPDDVTDEEIREEFEEWVWNEVGDHYSWYRKEE
jgi:hypothetical protein